MVSGEEVRIFVMLGGQEIIAEASGASIKSPFTVVSQPVPGAEGKSNVVFIPMETFVNRDGSITDFNRGLVVFSYRPGDPIIEKYKQLAINMRAKASGIVMPPGGIR